MSLKNTKWVGISRIFSRLRGFIPLDDEEGITDDIGEALGLIGAVTLNREAVCFVTVKNFRATLPKDCHSVIQLAKNNKFVNNEPFTCFKPVDAVDNFAAISISRLPITLTDYMDENRTDIPLDNCCIDGCEDGDWGYKPIWTLIYNYDNWIGSKIYKNHFTPIRLTENTFFRLNKLCNRDEYQEVYKDCGKEDEYNIIDDGKTLEFSFQNGQVAIAYNQVRVDEEGLPLIPDDDSFVKALYNYCIWMYFSREYYNSREGAKDKMLTAEGEWIWYCGQATNKALALTGIDEHQNMLDQRSRIIPTPNLYKNFFATANRQQRKNF